MLKEMVFHGWLFSALLTLFVLWERRQADGAGYHSIVVDRNGRGDFTSINQAISSVPDGNKEWVCIYVKSGIYRCERVLTIFILVCGPTWVGRV